MAYHIDHILAEAFVEAVVAKKALAFPEDMAEDTAAVAFVEALAVLVAKNTAFEASEASVVELAVPEAQNKAAAEA